jgi:hypothetical protein
MVLKGAECLLLLAAILYRLRLPLSAPCLSKSRTLALVDYMLQERVMCYPIGNRHNQNDCDNVRRLEKLAVDDTHGLTFRWMAGKHSRDHSIDCFEQQGHDAHCNEIGNRNVDHYRYLLRVEKLPWLLGQGSKIVYQIPYLYAIQLRN